MICRRLLLAKNMMKTIAAILYKLNKPLKIEEISIPELKEGQVLVKIVASGLCHSQLNEVRGTKGPDTFLPHTLGHEGGGIVEIVGPGVKKVKPGDHVVLTWIKGSGLDVPSAIYHRSDGSIVNSGAISTFRSISGPILQDRGCGELGLGSRPDCKQSTIL